MIEEYTYGCFRADGKEFLGDLMIRNCEPHYWQTLEGRKLEIKDVDKLLEEEPEVFVIGTGAGGLLKVDEEIRKHVMSWSVGHNKKIFLYIEKNTDAIKRINEAMKQGKNVCALLAGGC
jgi:hypothetical protein